MTTRSIAGYNAEAKRSREDAMKYCQVWQFEITKISSALTADLTSKKITQAVYNVRREDLKKQTEDLNKCIKTLNSQVAKP
jgi:uncharacterized FlaG/YvyC family protein